MWDGHDGMGWWMLWGAALWLLFIFAIVFLASWVGGRTGSGGVPPGGASRQPDTPLEIARRRYAAGEITGEEFEQIRRDLAH